MRTTRATWHPHGATVVRVERGAWLGVCQCEAELVQHKAELVGGAGEGSRWFVVVWPSRTSEPVQPSAQAGHQSRTLLSLAAPPTASTAPQPSTPTPPRPLESTRSSPPRRPPPSMASLLAHDYQSLAKEAGRRHSDVRDVRPPLPRTSSPSRRRPRHRSTPAHPPSRSRSQAADKAHQLIKAGKDDALAELRAGAPTILPRPPPLLLARLADPSPCRATQTRRSHSTHCTSPSSSRPTRAMPRSSSSPYRPSSASSRAPPSRAPSCRRSSTRSSRSSRRASTSSSRSSRRSSASSRRVRPRQEEPQVARSASSREKTSVVCVPSLLLDLPPSPSAP